MTIHPATDRFAYAEITGDGVDNDCFFNVRFRCQREGTEMALFRRNRGRLLYTARGEIFQRICVIIYTPFHWRGFTGHATIQEDYWQAIKHFLYWHLFDCYVIKQILSNKCICDGTGERWFVWSGCSGRGLIDTLNQVLATKTSWSGYLFKLLLWSPNLNVILASCSYDTHHPHSKQAICLKTHFLHWYIFEFLRLLCCGIGIKISRMEVYL